MRSMDNAEAIKQIRAWAEDHYEEGGDVIVEAFMDSELVETFIDNSADVQEAVDAARAYCELREDVRRDVVASGE